MVQEFVKTADTLVECIHHRPDGHSLFRSSATMRTIGQQADDQPTSGLDLQKSRPTRCRLVASTADEIQIDSFHSTKSIQFVCL